MRVWELPDVPQWLRLTAAACLVASAAYLTGAEAGKLEVHRQAQQRGLGEFRSTNGVTVEFRWIK